MAKTIVACAMLLFASTSVADARRHHHRHHTGYHSCYWNYCSWGYYKRSHHRRGSGSTSLSGVVAPLAEKVREIVSACGSRVISSVRHTHVAGSRRMSLHASGRAVDVAGNPGCIYRQLAGWTHQGGG